MKVIALKFENYRNLKDNIITPCDGVNIIYGDNAQGKTNLLEALWFFCGGHSFRGSKDSEIINWDENFARIEMRFLGQEREQTAKILFRGAICREKLKNEVVLSKYNRILNQRNSLLKDIYRRPSLADTLPVWDEPLLKSGAVLVKNRIDYVKMLSDRAVEYHNGISKGKEELKIRYMSGYEASEDDTVGEIYEKLKCKLEKHKSDDIRTGFTNYGPHRDDIEIIINGKNARAFASQGQQRSAVLSLKLAEASVLRERMGEEPVILLDDVLSELDAKRQDFLLNELNGCQVFITCCEKSNKEQLKDGKIFLLNNGEVS